MDYRAYLLDEQGHIIDVRAFVAPNDDAALSHAYQYVNGRDVEVWHRAYRVGIIPQEPTSIELKDRTLR
jgi:hypothetical protein